MYVLVLFTGNGEDLAEQGRSQPRMPPGSASLNAGVYFIAEQYETVI